MINSLSRAALALLTILLVLSPALAAEPDPAPVPAAQAKPAPQPQQPAPAVPEQTEPEVRPAAREKPVAQDGAQLEADDYRVQRALQIARDLLAKEQFTEALPLLQKLLESQHDRLLTVPGNNSQVRRSLKAEIRAILTGMSAAGLRSSELRYGAAARAALENALRSGQTDALTDVARQYPVTVAGRQAASLLADRLLDSGEPLAAARWLERLQAELPPGSSPTPADRLRLAVCWFRAGRPERASQILLPLRNEQRPEDQPAATAEQARQLLGWLQSAVQSGANTLMSLDAGWWLHQGNASRNTAHHVPEGTGTVLPQWPAEGVSLLADATADPDQAEGTAVGQRLRKSGRELLRRYREKHSNTTLPRSSPLVVGNTVFVRSFSTLSAFRLETGELLWESLPEATFEELALSGPEAFTGPILEFMVHQRLLGDATWATLSSDGTAIYTVEDSGFSHAIARPGKEGPLPVAATNRLVAFDPATGRRLWETGGGDGIRYSEEDSEEGDSVDQAATERGSPVSGLSSPAESTLAGMFFYGPPLPLSGRLYAIGETDGRIELVSVEHRSAGIVERQSAAAEELKSARVPQLEVSWRQMLDEVGGSPEESLRRRMSGGTPSASGGVLVCPTGTGSLVAVDLGLRTLLWEYRAVPRKAETPRRRGLFGMQRQVPNPERPVLQPASGWAGETVTLTDQHVLATVPGSNDLVCLDLLSGHIHWKAPRENSLYVAGVLQDRVLLAGELKVRCLSLNDGSPVWKEPLDIPCPSGRGFIRNGVLYLPVPEGGILLVDTETGRRIRFAGLPGNVPPGNIVGTRGVLLSADGDRLQAMPLPLPPDSPSADSH